MEKEISPSLAKRMFFFTKVILTFFIIGLLIFINFLDLKEKNSNSRFLNLIKNVQLRESELDFENFELERVEFLHLNNPNLGKLHIQARNQLVSLLKGYGASINRNAKGEGQSENKFILMTNDKNLNPQSSSTQQIENSWPQYTKATVDSAMATFNEYARPEKVYLLIKFDTGILMRKLDSILILKESSHNESLPTLAEKLPGTNEIERPDTNKKNKQSRKNSFTIPDVRGNGDGSFIDPGIVKTNGNFVDRGLTNNLQRSNLFQNGTLRVRIFKKEFELFYDLDNRFNQVRETFSITISAEIDSMIFPSTLHFARFNDTLVNELLNDGTRQQTIKDLFGYYELDMIESLTRDAITKNNDAVSILGFDISRKWFPLVMFLILSVIYALLYDTLKKAKNLNLKIISEYNSDEVLEFLIDKKSFRFFLWIITPLLLLFFVLFSTLIHYNYFIYGLILFCGLISILLGGLSYRISRSL